MTAHVERKSKTAAIPPLAKTSHVEIELLKGFTDAEIRDVMAAATIEEHPARSLLYRQGDAPGRIFLVESGLVRLSQLTSDGDDVFARFVGSGEVIGYPALAPDGSTVASATVIQQSRFAVWERGVALRLVQSFPKIAYNLFNIAVRDALYFYDRTRRMLTEPVGFRVQWAVGELVRTVGVATPAGTLIADGIGQRELADLAGTTIFTVSRELTKLQRAGILEKARGRIVVLRPEKLRA